MSTKAHMSEPASSTVGAALGWKLIGGLAGLAAIGAGAASLVVMCMMPPKSRREWAVGLTSTVIGSVCGGAFVVRHFNLQSWAHDPFGLVAMIGLIFTCGLPAWALVRWLFNYIDKRRAADIVDVAEELLKRKQGATP